MVDDDVVKVVGKQWMWLAHDWIGKRARVVETQTHEQTDIIRLQFYYK